MENGFLVFNKQDGNGYIVTDMSGVGKLLSVDRVTIWRLFKTNPSHVEYKQWIIVKGYEVIKSRRGKNNFKQNH